MKKIIILILLVLTLMPLYPESRFGEKSWNPYVNFDMMLVLKIGSEYSLSSRWGIKGAMGMSPLGITVFGYELLGVYHLKPVENRFQWDLEGGMPLAYFDALEGNVVDWDPNIDDPYAGWGFGAACFWGYRFKKGHVLGVKTGAQLVKEIQRDSGWGDTKILPYASIQWIF